MIAEGLVANGAKVYIASRKEKQLKEVTTRLNAKGPGSCHYVVADISSKAGCDALADAIKKQESKIHVLVNNSGMAWGSTWENTPEKEGWDRVMALNFKSIFYLTVACVTTVHGTPLSTHTDLTYGFTEHLAKGSNAEDPARVINVSSVAGWETHAQDTSLSANGQGTWSYNTSKAAVNHLTQQMAVTLSRKYITVNAICPGIFPSKMTQFGLDKGADAIAASHPMGRVGSASDMAGLILFLVSRASKHISGALIPIDGGMLIHGYGTAPSEEKSKL